MVVRLKGGDPFVFGRGGEELDAVRAAGVSVFVTPGITAATGCAAAANMALTHRNHAQAVTFVTGHAKGDAEPDLDWASLAALGHTLVVYMGVAKAETIAENLIRHGRAAETPAAVIENGTRPDQKIIKGTLADLGRLVAEGAVTGPALLVVGEVAALADGLTLADFASAARSAA
jgi:uroporphyrin-III C-methyltransferase/precorrin-2 dehydrogenase/sirohydrochlorin ferrochelatase